MKSWSLISRLLGCVAVALVFGFVPSPASAAEPYNSAQLKYLFEGSEIEVESICKNPTGGSSLLISLLKFIDSKSLSIGVSCRRSGRDFNDDTRSGAWTVKEDKLCLTAPNEVQFWRHVSNENCWKIARSKWGFAALDSKGDEKWTMSLESHPKHSTREELYAALDTVSDGTQIAEKKAEPKAEAVQKAPDGTYNSAQLKYLFAGSEMEGETICKNVNGNDAILTSFLKFQDSKTFSLAFECTSRTSDFNQLKGSGTWKIENNQLCLTAPNEVQFWRHVSEDNCWKIASSKWGFAALDSKGDENWTMSLESHPKHSSKEELYVALATISDVVEIAEQKAKAEAKKKAEADKQARNDQQRRAKEKQRQQELAEAKKQKEVEQKRQAAAAKKKKETQARKVAAQAKAKTDEAEALNVINPQLATVSTTLKTCLSSSPTPADQLAEEITALKQQVSCYDTALKEVGVLKTPVKRVQANINKQMKAISSKRQGLTRVLAQKQTKAKQIATAAAKRREEVKRKRKELVQRKKLAGTSDLFKGDARDFVFLANLSSENVTLGLSGDAAFLKSPIPTCYVAPTKVDISNDEFTAEGFGLVKAKTKSELSLKQCGDLDAETSDLIVFRLGIINSAKISTLSKLITAEKDGIFSKYFVVDAVVYDGRKLADKKVAEEAEKNKQAAIAKITEEVLSGKREGFGFVVTDPSSAVVCIEDGDTRAGAARVVTKKELGAPDHIADRPVIIQAASLEKTYINMKLKKCGAVFAKAKSLAMIYKALKRDKINAEFAHVWVDGKTLKAEGEKAKNEAVADEKARRVAKAERKQLETAQKKEKAAQLLKKETERKQKIKRKKAKLARQKKKKKEPQYVVSDPSKRKTDAKLERFKEKVNGIVASNGYSFKVTHCQDLLGLMILCQNLSSSRVGLTSWVVRYKLNPKRLEITRDSKLVETIRLQ